MSICLNNIGDILFELGRLDEAFSFQKEALGICESIDNIKVGFHGHNHLQLAFANTLVAIEKNVDINSLVVVFPIHVYKLSFLLKQCLGIL